MLSAGALIAALCSAYLVHQRLKQCGVCTVSTTACRFTLCRHVRGNWHNYHIYYNAEHPVIEENITFPNKILLVGPQVPIRVCPERGMLAVQHGPQPPQPARAPAGSEATAYLPTRDRWRPGYQGLFDVVCWLSDPTRSKLETHLANMMRSRVENGWPEKEVGGRHTHTHTQRDTHTHTHIEYRYT